MNLSVSNIAWSVDEDLAAYSILRTHQVSHIEVAPTRIRPNWPDITSKAVRDYRDQLETEGFVVSSLQAILFGRPELQLFGDQAAFRSHLERCAGIAAELGAAAVVFGAPKNRLKGALPTEEALSKAADFFTSVAPAFESSHARLCIEPNPAEYGGDFLTGVAEAAALVSAVNHPSVRLHLDTACLSLSGSDAHAVRKYAALTSHFHASEPFLAPLSRPSLDHRSFAEELRSSGYDKFVCLEMRAQPDTLKEFTESLRQFREFYGTTL